IQTQDALLNPLQNFLRRVPLRFVAQMKRIPRLVWHDPDVPLIDRIAAKVHVELYFLLQHHHQLSGVVESAKKSLAIMQSIAFLPPPAAERFEECRPAYVVENCFPIERVTKVPK